MRYIVSLATLLWMSLAQATVVTTQIGDANQVLPNNVYLLTTSVPLTAPRTLTLPQASRSCIRSNADPVCPANVLEISDVANAISGANTLTIVPAAGDTINGVATPLVISTAGGGVFLRPLPNNSWVTVAGGGGSGSGSGSLAAIIDVMAYGAVCDVVNDDAPAINNALAAAKAIANGPNSLFNIGPVTVQFPPNKRCLTLSPLNMTGKRLAPVSGFQSNGVIIKDAFLACKFAGGACIDALGASQMTFENINIQGSNLGIPDYGIVVGRLDGSGADQIKFRNINIRGCFNKAGYYNFGSEIVNWDGFDITTQCGTGYSVILDGMNHWNISSPFQAATGTANTHSNTTLDNIVIPGGGSTSWLLVGNKVSGSGIPAGTTVASIINSTSVTLSPPGASTTLTGTPITFTFAMPVNTQVSFQDHYFGPGELAGGQGVWIGGAGRPRFNGTYANASNPNCIITLYFRQQFAPSNIEGSTFDLHLEPFPTNYFCFDSDVAGLPVQVKNFRFATENAMLATTSVFKLTGTLVSVDVTGFDLQMLNSSTNVTTLKVFDDPTKWTVSGSVKLGSNTSLAAASWWNAPASFNGSLCLGAVCDFYPVQSLVSALPTCVAALKGVRRFVTNNATAAAYLGAVTNGGALQQGVICDGTSWKQN